MKVLAFVAAFACAAHAEDTVRVGSKRFTESYILGEILARASGGEHKPGLGATGILLAALKAGAIDVYPEYTGTIAAEVVHLPGKATLEELNRALAREGLAAGVPLGFNNSYALAMREERAQALAILRISDLVRHPRLKLARSGTTPLRWQRLSSETSRSATGTGPRPSSR